MPGSDVVLYMSRIKSAKEGEKKEFSHLYSIRFMLSTASELGLIYEAPSALNLTEKFENKGFTENTLKCFLSTLNRSNNYQSLS